MVSVEGHSEQFVDVGVANTAEKLDLSLDLLVVPAPAILVEDLDGNEVPIYLSKHDKATAAKHCLFKF
jgi:hypothetical protein